MPGNPAAAFSHSAHGSGSSSRADHDQGRAAMVGHQERCAIRADHPYPISLLKIAKIVGAYPVNRLAFAILGNPADSEGNVVVVRPFSITRAGHRVETNVVRLALRINSRRNDYDR